MSLDNINVLHKIKSEDLIFSDDIEDDRTNTYLTLNDYDWVSYKLSTRFRTKDMGLLNVEFEYVGFTTAFMYITKQNDCKTIDITYNFSTDIFKNISLIFFKTYCIMG